MEGSQVELPLLRSPTFHSQMILDDNSSFYNTLGYKVSIETHLVSIDDVDPEQLGKNAHLTVASETAGIPLRVSIDAVINIGDKLHLLSVYQSPGNMPLVSSFPYQDCLGYRLSIAVALDYVQGQMTYLFEPKTVNGGPVKKTLDVDLPTGTFYHYQTLFCREHYVQGVWRSTRVKLTTVSPIVLLTPLEFIIHEGVFCKGPVDPWKPIEDAASFPLHAIYWIPCAVYTRVSPSAHKKLRAQVFVCPSWAFSMSKYTVRFLVHQLIEFDFTVLENLAHSSNQLT